MKTDKIDGAIMPIAVGLLFYLLNWRRQGDRWMGGMVVRVEPRRTLAKIIATCVFRLTVANKDARLASQFDQQTGLSAEWA